MSIEILLSPLEAEAWSKAQRTAGKTIGFVATMGALHSGHLSLVEQARAENDCVCVSVFVNPLQFGEASDLDNYRRDLEGDARQLDQVGCEMVFTGSLEQFFPGQLDADGGLPKSQMIDAGPGALGLEGACRQGHFDGVATIVDRLFDVIEPTRAYFGQKDYQQTLVVGEVGRRRGSPKIVVCPIYREASGLARSSRNERLQTEERQEAVCLSRALSRAAYLWQSGERDCARLEAELRVELEGAKIEVEYAAVREVAAWSAEGATGDIQEAVAVVAARVGGVHLLDNHILADEPPHSRAALSTSP
ncbi:MAG: pantoate--beta-alanine ligase [Planctomycetota bacterium]|jgi:pantoate--beta-alanine ligase